MALFKPRVDRDEVNPDEPQPPATAVLDSVQPLQVEGGEGKIHEMSARHARLAIAQALVEAKDHLRAAADPTPLVRQYPLPAVGIAAVAGLVGALFLVPSEKQRAASRLRAIERAVRVEIANNGRSVASPSLGASRLVRMGLRYLTPTLMSMVTGALSGAATQSGTDGKREAERHPSDAETATSDVDTL